MKTIKQITSMQKEVVSQMEDINKAARGGGIFYPSKNRIQEAIKKARVFKSNP